MVIKREGRYWKSMSTYRRYYKFVKPMIQRKKADIHRQDAYFYYEK